MKKRNVLVGLLMFGLFAFLIAPANAFIISDECYNEIVDYNSSLSIGYYSTIKVDSDGNSHIVYCDYTSESIKYGKWNGTEWEIEIVPTAGNIYPEDQPISMDLDSNNYPHIAYCYEDGTIERLRYIKWNGVSWDDESVDSTDYTGGYNSIVIDSNNNPMIIYYNYADNRIDYAMKSGGTWNLETILFSASTDRTSIDVNSDNVPCVFFGVQKATPTRIEYNYGKKSGGTWNLEIVDTMLGIYGCGAIKIDSNNYPHVVYNYRETASAPYHDKIRYGKRDNGGWDITYFSVFEYNGNVYMPSLVMDAFDNPHIVYFMANTAVDWANLTHLYYDGYDWIWDTIDESGNCWPGEYSGIAYNSINNRIVFSYPGNGTQPYPSDTGLMYAYCNITEWRLPQGIYGNVYLLPDYTPDNHTDIICSNTTYSTSTTSNNSGYYQFDNLFFGNYWINASRYDYKDNNVDVEVAGGWNQTLLSNGDSL